MLKIFLLPVHLDPPFHSSKYAATLKQNHTKTTNLNGINTNEIHEDYIYMSKLNMVPRKFLRRIQRSIERSCAAGKDLLVQSLIMQLLHAVQCQWLIIHVELVGKQLGTRAHQL